MAAAETYNFVASTPGVRLDKFVTDHCPALTRTRAQKLIAEGHVSINGAPARSGLKLSTGDHVSVVIPPPEPSSLSAEAIQVKIVYEDDDLLVVDKPAGLAVHPAPGHPGGTLVNALLFKLQQAGDSTVRPGIVHRLDKDTSGLMVVARNPAAQANLMEQFKGRTVVKRYLALVRGRLIPERGIVEANIGRDQQDRKRMAVVTRGRGARTEYRVVKYLDGYSLLEVSPETGRTHQIRVHLAAIGHPVMGDAVYGKRSEVLSRQFLHACKLGFRLPSSGEYIEFTSELPPDLEATLESISRGSE